jgi:acyl-CoA dehydrogenase
MKGQATERLRVSVNDAMDVHGGKAVIEGPQNYMGELYRAVPIGITVEGANIVTRALIQFGQGSIRSHPYVLKEMLALEANDLDAFDQSFWGHVGHSLTNTFRAWLHAWTGGLFAPAPDAGKTAHYYRQLGRYSSAFALCVDMALLTLGGNLKRKEMISARFGDILSELFLLSAVLKRWNDEGRQDADLPLVEWSMETGLATTAARFDEILTNLPARPVAWLLRFVLMPLGPGHRGPRDSVTSACANILMEPSATRDRVTTGLYHPSDDGGVARLDRAFKLVVAAQPIRDRMRKAHVNDPAKALAQGTITETEAAQLAALQRAVLDVVNVDDFAPEELSTFAAAKGKRDSREGGTPSPVHHAAE